MIRAKTTSVIKRFLFPASMEMKITKADGRVIPLGKVTNMPIIGIMQQLMVNHRIKRYRKTGVQNA